MAKPSLEQELAWARLDLADARRNLETKERAEVEGRVTDPERHRSTLARQREYVAALESDEQELAGAYEPSDPKSPDYHSRMADAWDM